MKLVDPIPYAIPVFVFAILIEIIWTQLKRRHQYRADDTLTCLTASILSSIAGAYGAGIITFCYIYIYKHYRITDMHHFSGSFLIICWVSLFIIQDCAYYWFHRMAHRVNLLWASHITHHSSEEYNFAVALRQSSFQQFLAWPVYLPLAMIGYPPEWLTIVISFNLIYQFWVHTREIERLPNWIESIFNTPSHHRVHHGVNPQYLDKNYGGILIIWDKLFGTFESEKAEVRYGITEPLTSFNPIWVNVHHYWYLCQASMIAPDMFSVIRLWFSPPDWKPEWLQASTKRVLN